MGQKSERILVTGGAGFIGSNLVDLLVDEGYQVVVVDNFASGSRKNLSQHSSNENVIIYKADICDFKRMEDIFKRHGFDHLFHLAVQCLRLSITNPMIVHEVNAGGTLKLCMLAREHRLRRFVYVSSSEVYGTALDTPMDESHLLNPTTPYGASKLAGEYYVRSFYATYRMPYVIVRPFNTYGPREHFESVYGEVLPRFAINVLNDRPPLIFGDGEQTRDFTFVEDAVRGIFMCGFSDKTECEVINIARGQEVKIKDIARMVIDATGKSGLGPEYLPPRPGDVRRHYADTRKAKELLGFEARTEIHRGIEKYIRWLIGSGIDIKRALKQEKEINW